MQFIFLGIRLVTFPSQIYTQFSGRYLPDLPHHLEQPGTAGDAAPFQRWRNCEADRLIRPGLVGDHQIGRHRIKLPVGALRRGVEGLQANGDVGVRVQYSVRSLVKCFLIFYEEVLPDSEQILEIPPKWCVILFLGIRNLVPIKIFKSFFRMHVILVKIVIFVIEMREKKC